MFFDPDDYLLEDICEKLYQKIIKTKSDIVSANAIAMINGCPYYDQTFEDKREIVFPEKNFDTYKNFRGWATLYSKKFLLDNDIQFINTITNEDTFFVIKSYFNANKICYLDDYYGMIYYIRDEPSLSSTFSEKTLLSTIDAFLMGVRQN